jgi:hypothetical protein
VREGLKFGLVLLVMMAGGQSSLAQSGTAAGAISGSATDIKNTEIQATAQSDLSAVLTDRALRVVDIEGKYNVGVGVVHRSKTTGPDSSSAIEHSDITEVYQVISGSGTLVTGGAIEDG